MPRRGWSAMDVPNGWVQIIRGPRPKSVQWPKASAQRPQRSPAQQTRQSVLTGSGVASVPSLSRSPEIVAVEAAAEVKQLEAAIGVLGENNVHAKSLHEALRVARNKTKLPPIQDQVESCKSFLERARKRVLRAQAVIDRAVEQKAVYEKEVADGEVRLEALRAKGTNPPPLAVSSLVSELQQKIDNLVKERDALRPCPDDVGVPKISHKWMGQGPPSLENIPPMPTTDVQDLEGWLSDRNCDLRNAMEFGDSSLKGATHLGHLGQDVPMQDHTKSSMMSSLIDAADAKRRCGAAGSACGPTQ